MFWLVVTITAYFLNAIAMVIDKTLLKKEIKNPFVYTFYIAALGAVLMVFIVPFGLSWPGWSQLGVSLIAGGTFSIGLFFMFSALKREEASRLTPMIGGLTPVFVIFLAYFFLAEFLNQRQLLGFILIIIGTFLISLDFRYHGAWSWVKTKVNLEQNISLPHLRRTLWLALPAAFFFAISNVLTKDVYNHQPFLSGFIWTRLGAFIVVLMPMLMRSNRRDLTRQQKDKNTGKAKYRFFFGQACGGASSLLVQYAISIASVTLVQALQGTQYVFVFLIAALLTVNFPRLLSEKMSRQIVTQKIIAIVLIMSGIYFII